MTHAYRVVYAVAIAFFALTSTHDASAQEDGGRERPTIGPEAIRQQQPDFLVRADVDHITRCYSEGDQLSLRVTSEADAYLYVVYQQADGKTYQIFPNSRQLENRVRARQVVQVPDPDDLYRWVVGPPFGKEVIKLIASRKPIPPLADPALHQARFNPISPPKLLDTKARLLAQQPGDWSEHQIEITTSPAKPEPTEDAPRRFGVFFGISHFEFNAEAKQGSDGKWEPNRYASSSNATTLAKVMHEIGGLAGVRIYTDQEATLAQLEGTINDWLPAVSRPGDSIFIYICTHGGRFLDPERPAYALHRYTHYLLPYDFANPQILKVLLKQRAAGKLDPVREARVSAWADLVSRCTTDSEAAMALVRATCLTDPVVGHWLQRLDGRQVVVILEACHSSGFAEEGKALGEPADAFEFNFLEGQLPRLKDIGQAETVLLSACAADQISYTLRLSDEKLAQWKAGVKDLDAGQLKVPMSVMTYYLVDCMLRRPAPLAVEEAWRFCSAGMHDYFVTFNALAAKTGKKPLIEHQPRLFNYSSRPVLLKP